MSSPAWETGQGSFIELNNEMELVDCACPPVSLFKSPARLMKYLTKEQQKVLCVILLLLLTGLAVKTWRQAKPLQQSTNSMSNPSAIQKP